MLGLHAGTTERMDVSVEARSGCVETVMMSKMLNGDRCVKVITREECIPEVGDKLASRHGMKGIIGSTYKQVDGPFSAQGITPDLIFNPHGKPSRMSFGEMFEALTTMLGLNTGTLVDCTAFESLTRDDYLDCVREMLKELKQDPDAETMLYDGRTGKSIGKCFMGCLFIQRLKHMVNNKIHSRSRGSKQTLTQQPLEGRSRNGGMKTGEMEKDALVSHGASRFLRERLCEQSDRYTVPVCRDCGVMCIKHKNHNFAVCNLCGSKNVGVVEMPYSAKLVMQELMSMNVVPKLDLQPL